MVSEQPWSTWTKADYSLEQWHRACLIHLHTGAPTSKDECKLPVRTPSGALNSNGVHAAAAALAGARGGVNAPSSEISSARSALLRLYNEIGDKPPPSLKQSMSFDQVLEHFGVVGMRWGVRRGRNASGRAGSEVKLKVRPGHEPKASGGKGLPPHEEALRVAVSKQKAKKSGTASLSNAELRSLVDRMNLESQYSQLKTKEKQRQIGAGRKFASDVFGNVGKQQVTRLASQAATPLVDKAMANMLKKAVSAGK